MAVKPLTQPEYWATDAVYTTGPFIGQPQKVVPPSAFAAEGHRPGTAFPTPAEYENSQQHNLTGLARWVFAGSSAGAADAHPLETNAAGRTAATGLTIVDAVDENAVTISSSATALNFGLLVSCTTGGTAMATSIGNASAINYLAGTGSGALAEGVRVAMTGTPIGGSGVRVNANNVTDAAAVRVEHQGAGTGVLVTQTGAGTAGTFNAGGTGIGLTVFGNSSNIASSFVGGTNQLAIQAVAGTNAAAAVGVVGSGSSYGVDASGGNGSASADGVRGTATNANAAGVTGRSAAGAGAGSGVVGEGRGSGQVGVTAISQTGIALVAQGDTTSPTHPAMRLVPQDADPSASTTSGNVTWRDSPGFRQMRYCVAGYGYRSTLTFGPGSALYAKATQAFGASQTYGSSFTTILTASALDAQGNGFASNALGHQVLIRFTGEIRTGTAATDTCNVRFVDATGGGAGVPIFTWTGSSTSGSAGFPLLATTDWQRLIMVEVMYPPGADGDLVIRVEMARVTNNQFVRNGVLEIIGTF